MLTALYILIGLTLLLFGFSAGVIVSVWYYNKVIKPVDEEQKGGPSRDEMDRMLDDNEVMFDCESV